MFERLQSEKVRRGTSERIGKGRYRAAWLGKRQEVGFLATRVVAKYDPKRRG